MSTSILDLLIEAALRGTVLIGVSFGLSRLLRRAPAATLHWLWLLTLTAVLLMPIWMLVSAKWFAPDPAQAGGAGGGYSGAPVHYYSLAPRSTIPPFSEDDAAPVAAQEPASSSMPTTQGNISLISPSGAAISGAWAALILWLAGVVACLGYWLQEQVGVALLARRGTRVKDEPWTKDVLTISAALRLKRSARLILSERVTIPMACGFWRPCVFLPTDALTWTPERRQVVLTHELVHIKRGDTLTRWIGLLSCALHWLNPLVWWALRRLTIECERACDDRVLNLGARETDYADHLVDMARTALRVPNSMTALNHKSALSVRVRSILQPQCSRRPLSYRRGIAVMFSYTLLLALPLSAVRPESALYGFSRQTPADTTLILAVPGYMAGSYTPFMLREFEASHPGLRVVVNAVDDGIVAARYTDDYYTQLERYASAGDVLFVRPPQFGPAATLPGYFLDLTPLTSVDADLNVDDFYPAAWQSFRWDGQQWGLPLYWSLAAMSYDPAAFDAAGLAYPSDRWTPEDLMNAARILKSDTRYGLMINAGFNPLTSLLLSNLPGGVTADAATLPNAPHFDNPALATEIERWARFAQEDLIGPRLSPGDSFDSAWDADAPLQIAPLTSFTPNDGRVITLLPGGFAGIIDIGGMAVSAGTQHPEAAYELLKFLTTRPESLSIFGSSVAPARRSLFHSAANGLSSDIQPVFEEMAAHALPFSEPPFQDYISLAVRDVIDGSVDAVEALNQAADQAIADQRIALARRGTFTLSIPTPVAIDVPAGKIALRFGLFSPVQPLPNRERWEQVMADFAATDPQVGYVDLSVSTNPQDLAAQTDCFYQPFAFNRAEFATLLNLKPLMDADPAFAPDDFLPGILDRVRMGDQILGYPLSIQPQVLAYRADLFQRWNVPLPVNGWTTSDFVASLEALKAATGEAVMSTDFGLPEHLFLLVEAFGGLPIDARVFPPTVDFTSPQTVGAIRRALDLVRDGYLNYRPIRDPEFASGTPGDPALKTAFLDPFSWLGLAGDTRWSYVTYPAGENAAPVSIGVGAAYINRQAANPEACYRWIATLSSNPDLITTMPARTTGIDDPRLLAAQGSNVVEMYRMLDMLMRTPGALVTGTAFGGDIVEISYAKLWLYAAFEGYILNDASLEDVLADAQIKTEAYLGCAAQLALDAEYYEAHQECARRADPGGGLY